MGEALDFPAGPLLRGSLVSMRRRGRRETLYVSIRHRGRRRMICVPRVWEETVRAWVRNGQEIGRRLDELSEATLEWFLQETGRVSGSPELKRRQRMNLNRLLWRTAVDSPLGTIHLVATDKGLASAHFDRHRGEVKGDLRRRFGPLPPEEGETPLLRRAARALDSYFGGDLGALTDLPLDVAGTPFQESVWRALRAIPPGETRTYGQIARRIGRPQASRAVGAAANRNPVCLAIPCHRAVGSGGSLTGYAGGLSRKRRLLWHEQS